jgi:glycosyltransferase involved in cell wall biosynthesis
MKKGIIIIGKLPPPYFGPAIATEIILNSSLKDSFNLMHVNTKINETIETLNTFSWKKIFLLLGIYFRFLKLCTSGNNKVVLLPIAQESSGLYKDLVFILISKIFRKKVILHLRGSNLLNWYKTTARLNKIVFKFWFSRCAGAIVLGEKLRYIFEPFFSAEKIHVVPNGGNYNFPKKNKSEKIEILYLANLMKSKGLDILLLSLNKLENEILSKLNCKVVGSWKNADYKEMNIQFIEQNKLPVSIYPPTSGEKKMQFFSDADLFIFTPRSPEGHPWVIVEAMAAGLPIISTDQGAISESVLDNFNGYIISNEDSELLSIYIKNLVNNPAILSTMSKNSRAHYNSNFKEEIMIEKLSIVFNHLLTNT